MKFSCGRCGKKYATAETPAPGRVYKIKCKACGHLIVVKASAAGQQTATTELRAPTSTDLQAVSPTPPPSAVPEAGAPAVAVEVAPPEPHAGLPASPTLDPGLEERAVEPPLEAPPYEPLPEEAPARTNGVPAGAAQHDATQEITATALAAALQPAATPAPVPAPEPARYVDLFGPDPAKPDAEPGKPPEDAFAAAARASLPDGYGQNAGAPDPFAPLREELGTRPSDATAETARPAAAKVPVIARPAQQKSSGPIVLIAVGALVLVGILAFVLLGGQKAPPTPPPARHVAAAVPAAPPPVPAPPPAAVVPAAAVAPPAPAPVAAAQTAPAAAPEPAPSRAQRPSAADDRRAREERRAREKEAKEAKARDAREAKARAQADREAKAREKAEREAKAREERDAKARARQQQLAATELDAPSAQTLSPDQVQKVISSSRKAFDTCIGAAAKAGVPLDGRRVMLLLNIQPTGAVTYPTLDDVTLNGTDLGSCLKSAARVMVFPKFKGEDPMHVQVPLVLSGGR